ncbi:MAG: ATP-dependent nuclease [Candidatus Limnocylindria bacterium]
MEPEITRPLVARAAARAALARGLDSPWFRQMQATETDEDEDPLSVFLATVAEVLESSTDTLSEENVSSLDTAITRLTALDQLGLSATSTKSIESLLAKLRESLEVERFPSTQAIANEMGASRPPCRQFDDDNRNLAFRHDITTNDTYGQAFENLADLGGLNIDALRRALAQDTSGPKRTLLNNAAAQINRRLKDEWNQSDLQVDFDEKDLEVRITVAGRDGKQFDLEDRSDGMRMFLALCAFLAKKGQQPRPILLVDEVERHLHYAAQADIVSMFDRRPDVAQIVYSTHSIGCLPQDLGRGVRVIVADMERGTSTIDNLWIRDGHGIKPLIAAMGAATLPLQPSRPLVFGEGPSDALLLPSLLREAIDAEALDYLVVSGGSHVSRANIAELDRSAPHVVYLYDGDSGGREWKRFLKSQKVEPERIVALESGFVLEDLLEPALFAEACNAAIADIAADEAHMRDAFEKADVPESRRLTALAEWCRKHGYGEPSKLLLAETIIRLMTGEKLRPDRRWLDPRRRSGLRGVHEAIMSRLPHENEVPAS